MNDKQHNSSHNNSIEILKDVFVVFRNEFKTVFKDRGVVIIFVIASLVYPMLYCALYKNETLVNVPIAAVDNSRSARSRELLQHIDATPDVKIVSTYSSMEEAKKAFNNREVHGIFYIPADFDKKLVNREQTTVTSYCDMSSFLYYRAILQATNYTILDMGKEIQVERLNMEGAGDENAAELSEPMPFEANILFNPGMGFASFLMPAILILIIHQTLFFGISMLAGTSREENRSHCLVSSKLHRGGTLRVVLGKASCYLLMYLAFSFYILVVTPQVFNLPHIGQFMDLFKFIVPFLLATIFFSMTISVFFPERETSMILFLFFSLILLFLCGISWPQSNINGFWKTFSWIFPATHGIQGYIKINSMGADIRHVSFEYISLWIQTALYFLTASIAYRWQIKKSLKKQQTDENTESAVLAQ